MPKSLGWQYPQANGFPFGDEPSAESHNPRRATRKNSPRSRSNSEGGNTPARIVVDGSLLTLESFDVIGGRPLSVEITEDVWARVDASCYAVYRIE